MCQRRRRAARTQQMLRVHSRYTSGGYFIQVPVYLNKVQKVLGSTSDGGLW